MALITYKIVNDEGGKVKRAARTACNFWNEFVDPKKSIVIRLGVFDENSDTIAQAYEPYTGPKGIVYGRVEFNKPFLDSFSDRKVAATIVHEIGHTLGFGFAKWMKLFDEDTGIFLPKSVKAVALLKPMFVELDGGDGTALAHWDEEEHDRELMTGYEDRAEYVLPVTVAVLPLLGHKLRKPLAKKTSLAKLLARAAKVKFTKKVQAKQLDVDHFRVTRPTETLPHRRRPRRARSVRA